MSDRTAPGFLSGLVLGTLAGAALGLLWAPRSGQQNRELLRERFPELRAKAPEALNRVTEEVKSRLEGGREAFEEGAAATRERMAHELEETQRRESAAS